MVPLPQYAQDLAERVHDETRHPIVLLEEPSAAYDSQVRFAIAGRPTHEVAYAPGYRSHRVHFLVNAAIKVLRFWKAPPDDRVLPAATYDRLPGPEHEALVRCLAGLPSRAVAAMSVFLYHGLTRQVTSMPIDARVERSIAEQLPEHASSQRAYLERQVRELVPAFLPEVAATSPRRVYAASIAMNLAFGDEAASVGRFALPREFRIRSPESASLRDALRAAPQGHLGDRRAVDAWAAILGLTAWYAWRRVEPTP